MTIQTGTSAVTVTIEAGGCTHSEGFYPLNCPGHNYKHQVGIACEECGEQWFYPHCMWCE